MTLPPNSYLPEGGVFLGTTWRKRFVFPRLTNGETAATEVQRRWNAKGANYPIFWMKGNNHSTFLRAFVFALKVVPICVPLYMYAGENRRSDVAAVRCQKIQGVKPEVGSWSFGEGQGRGLNLTSRNFYNILTL